MDATHPNNKIEWAVHQCPKTLQGTVKDIFPELAGKDLTQLFIVQTWQQTIHNMSGFYSETELEREQKTGEVPNGPENNEWPPLVYIVGKTSLYCNESPRVLGGFNWSTRW